MRPEGLLISVPLLQRPRGGAARRACGRQVAGRHDRSAAVHGREREVYQRAARTSTRPSVRHGPRPRSGTGASARSSVDRRVRSLLVLDEEGVRSSSSSPASSSSSSASRNGLAATVGHGSTAASSSELAARHRPRCRRLGEEDVVLLAEALGQLATGERLGRGPTLGLAASRDVRPARPIPAGMSLPMMTFSLRPMRRVLGAVDGRLGQHPGRLLEGGRGEERCSC